MNFSAREDVDAPIQEVFDTMTDFAAAERAALRRGAEVTRNDVQGVGTQWDVKFMFRGKRRQMQALLEQCSAPDAIFVAAEGSGLTSKLKIDLVALSPRKTRIAVNFDVRPQTIPARIFLQSLRLTKSALTKRFKNGLHKYARGLEAKFSGTAGQPRA